MLGLRLIASSVGALAAALLTAHFSNAAGQAPAVAPTATPNPTEIYIRAVHEMRALAARGNPPYLVFDLHMDSHNLHWYPQTDESGSTDWDVKIVHANEIENYRVWYRSKDEAALIQDAATHVAYKGESPFAPEATDLSDVSGAKPDASPSPVAAPSPRTSPTSPSNQPAAAPASVLGAITVVGSRYYVITLVGIEEHAGHPVYHLHLRAIHDRYDYPLTDMWVDTSDYRVWAAHGELTLRAVAALLGVGVTVDFEPVDKYWLVSTIDLAMKGYVAFWHANTETSMQASIVSTPASLPATYFFAKATPKPH